MRENLIMVKNMEKELRNKKMDINIMVTGNMINKMGLGNYYIVMVQNMKAILLKVQKINIINLKIINHFISIMKINGKDLE